MHVILRIRGWDLRDSAILGLSVALLFMLGIFAWPDPKPELLDNFQLHVAMNRFFDFAVIAVLAIITWRYSRHLPNRKKIQGTELCLALLNRLEQNRDIIGIMELSKSDIRNYKNSNEKNNWYKKQAQIKIGNKRILLIFGYYEMMASFVYDKVIRQEDLVNLDGENIRILYMHDNIKEMLDEYAEKDQSYKILQKLIREIYPKIEKMYGSRSL